jgi:hypothetical protein
MQCPHCRLVIAPGRARLEEDAGAHPNGSAAGVLVNAARRQGEEAADEAEIATALSEAAKSVGTPVKRLRLLDYQRVAARLRGPSVSAILATHGTWKRARSAASSDH